MLWPAFSFGTCAIPVGRRESSDGVLDDIFTVSMPERVHEVRASRMGFVDRGGDPSTPGKKTQVWNHSVEKPLGCDDLERAAVIADPTATVRGSDELFSQGRGIKGSGDPVGAPRFRQSAFGQVDR